LVLVDLVIHQVLLELLVELLLFLELLLQVVVMEDGKTVHLKKMVLQEVQVVEQDIILEHLEVVVTLLL
tara:strand:+ start:173 stop:379 length:207 start_codon:yes stop_codon:yes gene_type:complete